jgi:hypothetical protein
VGHEIMIEKILDPYELKARVAPGLILALPLLAVTIFTAPVLSSWPIFATGSVVSLALIYGLSHVVGARGGEIEKKLWATWGGPPSTRFMRHRDKTFSTDLKASLYNAISREFSKSLLTENHEGNFLAEQAIVDAFRQVREYLRANDPDGLWFKHNIEYGFSRNLLGCREIWVLLALCSTVFAVVYGVRSGGHPLNPAAVIATLSLICAVYIGWAVLPSATKHAADEYAESAWMAFLRISEERGNKGISSSSRQSS